MVSLRLTTNVIYLIIIAQIQLNVKPILFLAKRDKEIGPAVATRFIVFTMF